MRSLETEKDMGPSILAWGVASWALGITAFFLSGWLLAAFIGFIVPSSLIVLLAYVESWRIPREARQLAEAAVTAFKESYPDYQVTSVALRATEPERYIYSIRYDLPSGCRSTPQARRYFAVARDTFARVDELETTEWWPRGTK